MFGLVARCNSGAEIAVDWCAEEAGGGESQVFWVIGGES